MATTSRRRRATFAGSLAVSVSVLCMAAEAPTVSAYSGRIGPTFMDDPDQSVAIPPGSSTVTLMPSGATSLAR